MGFPTPSSAEWPSSLTASGAFTEDVDILVSPQALKAIHDHLDGRGYVRPFEKSKNLRDAEFGVKIEFLVEGQFPGDGKPKPVAFPNPGRSASTSVTESSSSIFPR